MPAQCIDFYHKRCSQAKKIVVHDNAEHTNAGTEGATLSLRQQHLVAWSYPSPLFLVTTNVGYNVHCQYLRKLRSAIAPVYSGTLCIVLSGIASTFALLCRNTLLLQH